MGYLVYLLVPALLVFFLGRRIRTRHPVVLGCLYVVLTLLVATGMVMVFPSQLMDWTESWYESQGGGDPFGSGQMVANLMTAFAVGSAASLCLVLLLALLWRKRAERRDGESDPARYLANAP
jgi:formate hydrogenlyase subunit 3/multisubunit Na+/H+ antiporter MnhD subunit